jgi:hypothetical protein
LIQQPAPQVVGQLLRRRVAVRRVLLQRLQDDDLQLRGDGPVDRPRPPRLLEGDLPQQFLAVAAPEDRLQCQKLVQRCPQRVDVGAVVHHHPFGQRLLGAHVAQRAHQVAGDGQPGVALDVGQAKVGDPEAAAAVQQQVGLLDVAVDDAQLVGVVQRLGRLDAQLGHAAEVGPVAWPLHRRFGRHRRVGARQGFRLRLRCATGRRPVVGRRLFGRVRHLAALAGDDFGQAAAVDELHGVVVDGALAADGVDVDDVRVVQRGGRPGLVVEALQLPRVQRSGEGQHLEGHAAAQRELFGLVDHAHAAAADLPDDAEVAELAEGLFRRLRLRDVGGERARPVGGAADEVQRRQAAVEFLGQLGVAGQEFLARRRRALLDSLQVVLQGLGQAGFGGRRRRLAVLLVHRGSLIQNPVEAVRS